MNGVVLFLFIYLYFKDSVTSIKLEEIRVPAHAAEDGDAILGCHFNMEGKTLYAVKWYKDGREFYRYVPRNKPKTIFFSAPGITVDVSQSSTDIVTLVNLTKHSEGVYRCEVSGESPFFTTVFDEKYIKIHLLPKSGPIISGLPDQYQSGDRLLLNCTSEPSRPETYLKWWVNDHPVPRSHIQGPWYRISPDNPDATITILQLKFTIKPKHYVNGVLKVKCVGTVAPLYQKDAIENFSQEMETTTAYESANSNFFDAINEVKNYYKQEAVPNDEFSKDSSATNHRISSTLLLVLLKTAVSAL